MRFPSPQHQIVSKIQIKRRPVVERECKTRRGDALSFGVIAIIYPILYPEFAPKTWRRHCARCSPCALSPVPSLSGFSPWRIRYTVGLAEASVLSARSATGRSFEYISFDRKMSDGKVAWLLLLVKSSSSKHLYAFLQIVTPTGRVVGNEAQWSCLYSAVNAR
jgi:hypothetical protein